MKQSFGTLPKPPPLAIVDLARVFFQEQAEVPVKSFFAQMLKVPVQNAC